MEPICKIRLPSHHPAVRGLKKGERVHLEAEKAEERNEPIGMKDEAGEGPPPLETPFHVHAITKARGKPAAAAKPKNAMEYLKGKRGAAAMPAPAPAEDSPEGM